MKKYILPICILLYLAACNGKKPNEQKSYQPRAEKATDQPAKLDPILHTDTLQFIHFEGNFDYWSCVFINASKDTVTMVTDSIIEVEFKNRLFEVKWFTDTLYEAGDNDSKYAADRMAQFRVLKGTPFIAPITEEKILLDIKDIPEVRSGADQVGIVQRPSEERNYYLVETGTHGTDNFSRFLMFRVYTYPRYMIKVYDPSLDMELTMEEWKEQR